LNKIVASIVVIILIGSVLGVMFYSDPSIFNGLMGNSILSVSNISIAPQGYEDSNGKWTGSFWTILMATDINDQYGMYTFSDSSLSSSNDKIDGKTIDPQATITVKVIPQRPYYLRALQTSASNVYPATQTYMQNKFTQQQQWFASIPKMDVSYNLWGEQYWELHTPFQIQVLKNGAVIVDQTVDTLGTTQTITLTNPNDAAEWLSIKDLGKLSSGYGEPQFGEIVMFSPTMIFHKTNSLMAAINYNSGSDYTYSNYWFGGGNYYRVVDVTTNKPYVVQKDPNGAPGGFALVADRIPPQLVPVENQNFPGNYRNDDLGNYKVVPLSANILNDQSGGNFNPSGKSLINYLKMAIASKPAETVLADLDAYHQGAQVRSDNKIQVNLPFGASSSLVTMQISTELADAVVYEPPVADIRIDGLSWVQGDQIGDSSTLKVDVSQHSTITSTATVSVLLNSYHPVQVTPASQQVTLGAGESTSIFINVLNTGAQEVTTGTLTVTVANSLGDQTDSKNIQYTLLPRGVGSSQLTVFTVDKITKALVSGITCTVAYGQNSPSGVTSSGSFTIDLEGYTGPVTVTSVETEDYQVASASKTIGLGMNTITLEVLAQGAVDPKPALPWTLILIVVGVVVACGVFGGIAFKVRKGKLHKGKMRRRR
jgi:hypothetical protein